MPVLRGTGIRVLTLAVANHRWELSPSRIAEEYDLSEVQVNDALAFYHAHGLEIDAAIAAEQAAERDRV